MSFIKTRCPSCQRKLVMPKSTGHVRCPKCNHRFALSGAPAILMSLPASAPPGPVAPSPNAPAEPSAASSTSATATIADSATLETPPAAYTTRMPQQATEPEPSSYSRLIAVGIGGALFLAAGIWLLIFCLRNNTPAAVVSEEPFVELPFGSAKPQSKTTPVSAVPQDQVLLASAKTQVKPPTSGLFKAEPLVGAVKPVAPSTGVDQAKIDRAIERGATYLHKAALGEGRIGAKALAGLTLLHCGFANADPVVADIAGQVRKQAPHVVSTYELSLCVMFLDRLGAPGDRPLIRSIALQLIAGQGMMGGWNYQCRVLNPSQQQQLLDLLNSREPLATSRINVPSGKMNDLPVLQHRPGTPLQYKAHAHEDNSLTQFAVLALWTAKKHGVPAERSLAMVDARFRASQASDGSWAYTWTSPAGIVRTDSMTCAGLIGLAVGRGNVPNGNLKEGDPAIDKALRFVSQKIGIPGKPPAQRGKLVGASSLGDFYYLWTLERAAVIFDLQTIGGRDWYAWGAPIIVANQFPAGNWQEAHGAIPDTCFALLFLKRANVAQDLTVRLQDLAISKHIGERTRDLDRQPSPTDDPFGRRSSLTASQREAAGYSRGREDFR